MKNENERLRIGLDKKGLKSLGRLIYSTVIYKKLMSHLMG